MIQAKGTGLSAGVIVLRYYDKLTKVFNIEEEVSESERKRDLHLSADPSAILNQMTTIQTTSPTTSSNF